jgi:hypothetical protein
MKKSRRTFLRLLVSTAAAGPLVGRLPPVAPAPAASRFHMVNGWILTEADVLHLREIGLRA